MLPQANKWKAERIRSRMPEKTCKHEWEEYVVTIDYRYDSINYRCKKCKIPMMPEEIERRLNACEALSSEDAREIWANHNGYDVLDRLLDYARILEGE